MATLSWRDNDTGQTITAPWRISSKPEEPAPLVRQTPLGKAVIFFATFEDGSVIVAMMHPGGARFMRITPQTAYAVEEHFEGEVPPEIAAVVTDAWRDTVSTFASRARELREAER